MKRLFAILFFLVSFSMAGYSYVWSWGHTFNGQINDLVFYDNYVYTVGTFSDSSFILGTDTITNHGGCDVMIIKWNKYGDIVWARSIYGSLSDSVSAIILNSKHELIIFGDFTSANLIAGNDTLISNGGKDIFIAKYDLNGNFLKAFNDGGNGNDFAYHFFLDNMDNMYAGINGYTNKYDSAGVFISTYYIPAHQIAYSPFDSTIVSSGTFSTTMTYGNDTIVPSFGYQDIFLTKTKLDGTPIWLKNLTNYGYDQNRDAINVNPINGKIYLGYNGYGGGNGPSITFRQLTPEANVLTSFGEHNPVGGLRYLYKISSNDSIVSLLEEDIWWNIFVFNVNTNTLLYKHNIGGGFNLPPFQLIIDENTIYTLGHDFNNNKDYKFGRIGSDILAYVGSSNQTIHKCLGDTAILSGNIYFGLGNKTFSWAPVTGLNNTNTNTVSFPALSNITYTLTVTDSTGHIKKDTFNIIIDTLLSAPTLTSQYPAFCSDSMLLYSNIGVGGTWKKFNPILNTWGTPFLSNSINATIYSAGKYLYLSENSCGMVSDTIDIMPVVTVIANTSQDTLCSGQSVTIYGTGALSYVWSGGVIDSIPFTPLSTQIYTVTGTDGNGCNSTSSVNIVVNPTPVISNIKALPNSFCSMGNAVLSFETNTQYCIPTVQYPGGIRCISNFNFNGINNYSGPINSNYTYYNLTPIVVAGLSYPSSLTVSGGSETYRRIWIDFNHDGDFDDLNEMVFAWWGTNTTNSNILIPFNAVNGITRMRVACRDMAIYGPPPTACNNDNYGEYEDYNLNITGGTAIPTWLPNTFLNTNVGNNIQVTNINTTTTYTVAITNLYGCSNSDSVTITRRNPSSSSFDTAISFNSIPYLWNGQSIFASGTYTHIATNAVGCDSTASITVKVNELQNNINLFPNPSSGMLTINYVLSDSLDVSIILFDINGRAVHSFLIDNLQQKGFHRHIFDLDKLGIETGVYFFRIKLGIDTYIRKLLYH